jgi:hypothetical protein
MRSNLARPLEGGISLQDAGILMTSLISIRYAGS